MAELKYLLLQIRDPTDPMRHQEVGCFARAIGCDTTQITTFDLLTHSPAADDLDAVDAVLIGGSGDYSAASESNWLDATLESLRCIYEIRKPTFASCWGFQAFARAMGGRCIHDPAHAELGTLEFRLTDAGRDDPLFGPLGEKFLAQAGHEDHVVELPRDAVLLASSEVVTNQAFRFADAPIYCTQFHPELDRESFIERIVNYPQYVEKIAGTTFAEFAQRCQETHGAEELLKRFSRFVADFGR